MDVWEILKLMVRRWYFSIPLLLLTVVSSVVMTSGVEIQYEASAGVRLIGPKVKEVQKPGGGVEEVPTNPLIEVPPFLNDNADNLATYFLDPELAESFEAEGLSPLYTVDAPGGSGLTYTVTGDDENQAIETATRLITETEAQLSRLQSEVVDADFPENRRITVQRTLTPDSALPVTGKKVRVAAITFALGLGITFALILILEALGTVAATRRHRRDSEAAANDEFESFGEEQSHPLHESGNGVSNGSSVVADHDDDDDDDDGMASAVAAAIEGGRQDSRRGRRATARRG